MFNALKEALRIYCEIAGYGSTCDTGKPRYNPSKTRLWQPEAMTEGYWRYRNKPREY